MNKTIDVTNVGKRMLRRTLHLMQKIPAAAFVHKSNTERFRHAMSSKTRGAHLSALSYYFLSYNGAMFTQEKPILAPAAGGNRIKRALFATPRVGPRDSLASKFNSITAARRPVARGGRLVRYKPAASGGDGVAAGSVQRS